MLSLDNRKERRSRTLIAAFVSDLDDRFVLKCLIRDVSRGGCRLVSTDIDDLPDVVQIVPEGFDKPLYGRIVWRQEKMAGVQFVDRSKLATMTGTPPARQPLGFLHHFQVFSARGLPGRAWRADVSGAAAGDVPRGRIATVARELRARAASVLGALRLLTNGMLGRLPRRARSLLGGATADVRTMAELIDDLPEPDDTGPGTAPTGSECADIPVLVRRLVAANEPRLAGHGIRLILEDEAGRALADVDAAQIEELLASLIAKAARACRQGSTVVVSVRRTEARIRIAVGARTDHAAPEDGTGAKRSVRARQGGGHDLRASQAIAAAHGSRIHIKSEAGKGTVFWLDLQEVEGNTEKVLI